MDDCQQHLKLREIIGNVLIILDPPIDNSRTLDNSYTVIYDQKPNEVASGVSGP